MGQEELDHITAMNHAMEEAFKEGQRNSALRIERLKDAIRLALVVFSEHKIGGGRVECIRAVLEEKS